jgi:hypothetical protein
MGIVTQIGDLDNSSKKSTAFSNSKGGGLKRLMRPINPSLTW